MSALQTLSRLPRATLEFANVILTTPDAAIGQTPRDVVWTHRKTTLTATGRRTARTRSPCSSSSRSSIAPTSSICGPVTFVEFLLDDGFDVFLVDWGVPDEEDADMRLGGHRRDPVGDVLRAASVGRGEERRAPDNPAQLPHHLPPPVPEHRRGQPARRYQAMAKWVADTPPSPRAPTATGSPGFTRRLVAGHLRVARRARGPGTHRAESARRHRRGRPRRAAGAHTAAPRPRRQRGRNAP